MQFLNLVTFFVLGALKQKSAPLVRLLFAAQLSWINVVFALRGRR